MKKGISFLHIQHSFYYDWVIAQFYFITSVGIIGTSEYFGLICLLIKDLKIAHPGAYKIKATTEFLFVFYELQTVYLKWTLQTTSYKSNVYAHF